MSKRAFFALATAHNIEVDYEPGDGMTPASLMVWAPDGKRFKGTDTHCDGSLNGLLTDSGLAMNWGDCIKAMSEIIGTGLEACPDTDCEVCNTSYHEVESP